MVGVMFLVAIIVFGVLDLGKGAIKDLDSMTRSQTNGLPYWTDSKGYTRLKGNNKKVTIRVDSEGHYIATDYKGNKTDLTFEQNIKPYITKFPGLIWKYGHDYHKGDKISGQRYISYYDGQYTFYVIVKYKGVEFYVNADTGEVVRPTYTAIKREEKAYELGLEYYTETDINNLINELNAIPEWKRSFNRDYKQRLLTSDESKYVMHGLQLRNKREV